MCRCGIQAVEAMMSLLCLFVLPLDRIEDAELDIVADLKPASEIRIKNIILLIHIRDKNKKAT
jgi:hypothetical protein